MMLGNIYDIFVITFDWKNYEWRIYFLFKKYFKFYLAFKNEYAKNIYQNIPTVYLLNDETITGKTNQTNNYEIKNFNFVYKKMFPL